MDIFHRALLAEQNIIRQRLELGYEPLYHGAAFVRGDIICLPFLAFLATVNYQTHVSRRKNRKAAVVCLQDRVYISDNIYIQPGTLFHTLKQRFYVVLSFFAPEDNVPCIINAHRAVYEIV